MNLKPTKTNQKLVLPQIDQFKIATACFNGNLNLLKQHLNSYIRQHKCSITSLVQPVCEEKKIVLYSSADSVTKCISTNNIEQFDSNKPANTAFKLNKLSLEHIACAYGDSDLIKFLKSCKHSFRSRNDNEETCLHVAVFHRNVKIIPLLINIAGLSLVNEIEPTMGYTAMHIAVARGYLDCASILFRYKADLRFKDVNGLTARELAENYFNATKLEVYHELYNLLNN